MGCLKLTYYKSDSFQKVVPSDLKISVKGCAGDYRYGFNGMEKDDEVKGRGNSYDFGARMYDSRLGRWLTIDLLASKYPSLSSYNFVGNSPVVFVDPDGNDIIPYGEGHNIISYLSQLRASTSLTIEYDVKANRIKVFGTPTNDADKKLLEASMSDIVDVNIYLTDKSYFTSRSGIDIPLLGGSFEGSQTEGNCTITTQWVNPNHMKAISEADISKNGVLHETLESYIGAIDNPGYIPTPKKIGDPENPAYTNAHGKSNSLVPFNADAGAVVNKNGGVDFFFANPEYFNFEEKHGYPPTTGYQATSSFNMDKSSVTNTSTLKKSTESFQKVIEMVSKVKW